MSAGSVPLLPNAPLPPGAFTPIADPILKFFLLADVTLVLPGDHSQVVSKISQLATRADHFYVSFNVHICDYKVLFGGNRPHQKSFSLIECRTFLEAITCVHSSKTQQSLLVIGTELGCIYTWDVKRAPGVQYMFPHGTLSQVNSPEAGVSCVVVGQVAS